MEEERVERIEDPENGEDCCETLSFGYDVAVCTQLWLPEQEQTSKNSSVA